jgi:phosphoglycerate dehydrogenase-like enzyme
MGAAAIDVEYYPQENDRARLALSTCNVVFGNPPAAWLTDATRVQFVQLESAGFGEYLSLAPIALARRLKIANLKGFFAEPVAESILAGILSHFRGIGALARLQERIRWVGDDLRPHLRTLKGAAVVLFGNGDINNRLSEMLVPFGCSVRRFGRGWVSAELNSALSVADVLVCTVPHTAETSGLFDRALIEQLKAGALFVNFGRGSLVDENALADALDSGRLGGAVIDVTSEEPLPLEHRFWNCPNLLLTQHTGGGTADEIDRKIDVFLANLTRYRSGEEPLGLIDFQRGY